MHISSGKRDGWEFECEAIKLAEGATRQKEFRDGRVKAWKKAMDKLMAEVKESGIEINESAADLMGSAYTSNIRGKGCQTIIVRPDLQAKLKECQGKIKAHQQAADEYDGWVQVLTANPETRLKLTHADWLYFFGKA